MSGGVRGDSHEFGLRPADLHPTRLASSCNIMKASWSTHADGAKFTELYPEATTAQQATHDPFTPGSESVNLHYGLKLCFTSHAFTRGGELP